MSCKDKKILIATGGTGGHVLPAQAFALQMKEEGHQLRFMGSGLHANRYFQQDAFERISITSETPFRKGVWKKLSSIKALIQGSWQAFYQMKQWKPDVVVGFGSFHAFPVLVAAWLHQVPMILFEPNSIPGKVNRFFSHKAAFSGIQFPQARERLKGNCKEVSMPSYRPKEKRSCEESKRYFSLDPHLFTFLVFGGSQGALAINEAAIDAFKSLKEQKKPFQVLHFIGNRMSLEETLHRYEAAQIRAVVKPFEEKMYIAWQAADFAICRSGASTVAEILAFEVPSLLIPYPFATDQHQLHNAHFLEKEVQGALCLEEKDLTSQAILQRLDACSMQEMKASIQAFKQRKPSPALHQLVQEFLLKAGRD